MTGLDWSNPLQIAGLIYLSMLAANITTGGFLLVVWLAIHWERRFR